MRPHEEEWKVEQRALAAPEHLTHVIMGPEGVVGAFVFAREATLASAAPDMARALMAFLSENGHTPDCGGDTPGRIGCSDECASARAALAKAGVIP